MEEYRPYVATVYVSERDPQIARERAVHIYDLLGPGFFETKTRAETLVWIESVLVRDELRVDFYDAQDAMLFKLACGGR